MAFVLAFTPDATVVNSPHWQLPKLDTLVGLFYSSPDDLGRFAEVVAEDIPRDYQTLLAHEHHMTVTVEQFHNSPVNVLVLDTVTIGNHYARKILLTRQVDGGVVQFGIMRVNFDYLDDEVRREIEGQTTPLGRILIEHNVHRDIHLRSLWQVEPGADLQRLFGLRSPQRTYGRTAMIYCNDEPAIELLEIVTPVEVS
jgi:chorismate-pyruvate lyase